MAKATASIDLKVNESKAVRGLQRLSSAFKSTSVVAKASFAAVGTAAAGATAAVGGLAAAFEFTRRQAEVIEWQRRLAENIGVTTERFSALTRIAGQFGAEADDVQDVLKELSVKARDASQSYKDLGITVTDANGRYKDAWTLLGEVQTALQRVATQGERNAIIDELASDAGIRLAGVFRMSREELQKRIETMRRSGEVITSEQAAIERDFSEALREATADIGDLSRAIGTELMEEFTPMLASFSDWLDKLQDAKDPLRDATDLMRDLAGATIKVGESTVIVAKGYLDLLRILPGFQAYSFVIKRAFDVDVDEVARNFSGLLGHLRDLRAGLEAESNVAVLDPITIRAGGGGGGRRRTRSDEAGEREAKRKRESEQQKRRAAYMELLRGQEQFHQAEINMRAQAGAAAESLVDMQAGNELQQLAATMTRRRQVILSEYELEVINAEERNRRLEDVDREHQDRIAEIRRQASQQRLQEWANEFEQYVRLGQQITSAVQGFADQQTRHSIERAEERAEAEIAALERSGASAEVIAEQKAAIEQRLDEKREQLEKAAFERNKAVSLVNAVINTALGVTQALSSAPPPASFILAGLVAAAGAVQIATIASSQYSGGGGGVSAPSVGGVSAAASGVGAAGAVTGPVAAPDGATTPQSVVVNLHMHGPVTNPRRTAREVKDALSTTLPVGGTAG